MSAVRRSPRGKTAPLGLVLAVWLGIAVPLQAQTTAGEADLEGAAALGWVEGAESSLITVVEFTDVSCPYCASFHAGTRAELIREFVDSGKVQWVTLTYISGLYPNSEAVSLAAECAGRQGHYDRFMSAAYEAREEWVSAPESAAATTVARLVGETELDTEAFVACVEDPSVRQRLDDVRSLAGTVGVRGTPTWFVDGFLVMGDLPFGYARSFIERRLPSGN